MKVKEAREKSDKELDNLLKKSREKLFEMNFKKASEQLKKNHEIKKIRRDIARILTVLNERRLQKEIKDLK